MDATCDLTFDPVDGGGWFGVGLDIGNIENDNYKDIVIGAMTYPSDSTRYGRAYLYWGDSQENMDADCDLIFEAENAKESQNFGVNVGIGDVDDDGYEDIVIGAFTFNNTQGRAYLYYGDKKEKMDAQAELVLTGENKRDWFGDPPGGSFGDFNNDGYDDLAIGARRWQSNSEQGRVYLYYGGPTVLLYDMPRKRATPKSQTSSTSTKQKNNQDRAERIVQFKTLPTILNFHRKHRTSRPFT